MVAPVLLMVGLTTTPASSTSLLLNLEGVLTALLAWFAFRENFDRRIFMGMIAIVAGGLLLSWSPDKVTGFSWEALAIVGACFCWAIDNNLTRKISGSDPSQIAMLKGLSRWNSQSCDRSSDERKSTNHQRISGRWITRLPELRG